MRGETARPWAVALLAAGAAILLTSCTTGTRHLLEPGEIGGDWVATHNTSSSWGRPQSWCSGLAPMRYASGKPTASLLNAETAEPSWLDPTVTAVLLPVDDGYGHMAQLAHQQLLVFAENCLNQTQGEHWDTTYTIDALSGLPGDTVGWRLGDGEQHSEYAVTRLPDGRVLLTGTTWPNGDDAPITITDLVEVVSTSAELISTDG